MVLNWWVTLPGGQNYSQGSGLGVAIARFYADVTGRRITYQQKEIRDGIWQVTATLTQAI